MFLTDCHIDKSWTLFLDRDGVVNQRIVGDYVKTPSEFSFIEQVPQSIKILNVLFGHIFIVTNQQGIGKGLMSTDDLEMVHSYMLKEIEKWGGKIDRIYFCPELAESGHEDRKPSTGMAFKAKRDFPEISFVKSIMVGDSVSDMKFGKNAGMKTVFISKPGTAYDEKLVDLSCGSLAEFVNFLTSKK